MPKFEFIKIVNVERDLIFQISTDYEKFTEILPDYFKELEIIERNDNVTKIQEKLQFLGKTVDVLTEHVVEKPDTKSAPSKDFFTEFAYDTFLIFDNSFLKPVGSLA